MKSYMKPKGLKPTIGKPTVPQPPHFHQDFGEKHDCIAKHGFVHPHRIVKVPKKF